MLPNSSESPPETPPSDGEIEPIAPETAEAILTETLQPYLDDGWIVLHQDAYFARLTKGLRNLDIRVDLLGQIEQQESGLTPLQESGRLSAWVLLLASLLVVLVIATILGII